MGSLSKVWAVLVCIAIGCGMTTVANAALLRDVRVGEHKDFTRLVFEFGSVTRYSQPILKVKDTISVTFLKSKTPYTLTRRDLQRSTKHFNTITFDQQGSDLTAHVTVTSPRFELKAFSLLRPYRVVIDVYWLDTPLQATVAPPSALQNVKKPAPLTQPDKVAISRSLQTTTPGTIQLAQVILRYSRLQLYLMVVLIALNIIIIIIIFAAMSRFCLRKTEFSKYGEDDEIADTLAVQDSTTVSIDNEIREKFQKYEAL